MLLRQLKSTRETDRGSTQPAPSPCWEVHFLISSLSIVVQQNAASLVSLGYHAVFMEQTRRKSHLKGSVGWKQF